MPELMSIVCANCGVAKSVKPTSKGNPRPPRGWKRVDDELTCQNCWHKKYVVRAVTIPIVGPIDGEWKDLRETLKRVWAATTELANWADDALAKRDVIRTADMEKIPKMPPVYMYGLAEDEFHRWSEIDKSTAVAILNAVEAKYRATRFFVIWLRNRQRPAYKYPQPLPLSSQNWNLVEHKQRLAIDALIGGKRWQLMLRGGRKYRRQIQGAKWLLAHPELCCQASVFQVRANEGDHRSGDQGRDNSGGQKWQTRVMCKLVGWFPRRNAETEGVMAVRTDGASLLVALDEKGDRLWVYNADHARRLAAMHQRHLVRLQRLSEDTKFERRRPRRDNRAFRSKVQQWSEKDQRRIKTLCDEASASVVAFASRRKYASIQYQEDDKSFCQSFPWAMLKTLIQQKSAAAGIEVASAEVEKKTRWTARNNKNKEPV